MDSHISEFSYGYALTSELIALFSLKPVGAPEFATQSAEGKKGGGWDVKLPGVPVYLQFKRADRMVRRSAQEAGVFKSLPFFRMYLHPGTSRTSISSFWILSRKATSWHTRRRDSVSQMN